MSRDAWSITVRPAGTTGHATPSRSVGVAVHVETNGYILRSLVPDDVTPRFLQWLNEPELYEGLNLAPLNFSAETLRAYISNYDNRHHYFIGIFDRSKGLLIGFYTLDTDPRHRLANITAAIGEPDYRGRRVFWATIDALLDHFFAYRDVAKVTARVLARNRAMLFNFVDNTRFVFEARLRKECIAPDGARLDLMIFSAFRDGSKEDGTAP